jgi:hypothetical protein
VFRNLDQVEVPAATFTANQAEVYADPAVHHSQPDVPEAGDTAGLHTGSAVSAHHRTDYVGGCRSLLDRRENRLVCRRMPGLRSQLDRVSFHSLNNLKNENEGWMQGDV